MLSFEKEARQLQSLRLLLLGSQHRENSDLPMILGDSLGLQREMYYSEQYWRWWSPAPGWVPTSPGVLSMLCDGFLEFLRIVYDSFQRYTFVIFISCDVNWRIMLKGKRCTKNSLWSHSLWIMKTNYLYFFPLSDRLFFFSSFDIFEIYSIPILDYLLPGITFSWLVRPRSYRI